MDRLNIEIDLSQFESYWISNNDDGTYDVSIETKNMSVNYRNVYITLEKQNGFIIPHIKAFKDKA